MVRIKKLNMNSKERIKIIDRNFAHAEYSSDYQISKHIDWVRDDSGTNGEIIFLTDHMLQHVDQFEGKKIGWLMEPKSMISHIYEWVKYNYNKFDTIITYDKDLIDVSDNIIFYPHSGCWIKKEDQEMHQKTKLLSIIASNKSTTVGHKLRHDAINLCKTNNIDIDLFGRVYNPIEYKLMALKDYAFTIVIENIKYDYYFTEKLMDSFVAGTIPIYWGCPSIGNFFNTDGMIIFDDLNHLFLQLNELSFEKYHKMKSAAIENLGLAQEYMLAEDWVYNNTQIFK